MPPTPWEVAPATVTSHQHRCVSLEVSAGQILKNTQAFTGHRPCAPGPTLAPIPIQILLQKA